MTLEGSVSARARRLIQDAVVWDNHGCMPLRADAGHLPQLERYRAAGVTVVSLNVGYGLRSWDEHLEVLTFMRGWIGARPQAYRLISTAGDVSAAKASGQLGVVFDVEGMRPVQDDPGRVARLYELGVRWMLVAYNRNNAAGGGCLDDDQGLTEVGRAIIDTMDQVGMVLCLSHSGSRTAAEALAHTRNPAIFSHSNPKGDTPHPRNVSDDLMRACAAKGGVVGLSGIGPFLGADTGLAEALLRQLDYVIGLVGPEHVGLGLDYVFDRAELEADVATTPALHSPGVDGGLAMTPPEAMGAIAEGLCRQDYSDLQVRGVLGENWLRIARQVWR